MSGGWRRRANVERQPPLRRAVRLVSGCEVGVPARGFDSPTVHVLLSTCIRSVPKSRHIGYRCASQIAGQGLAGQSPAGPVSRYAVPLTRRGER